MSLRGGNGVSSSQRDALMALSNVRPTELWRLIGFASYDLEVAGKVASSDWFLDGVHDEEQRVLDALVDIASQDLELASLLTKATWLDDGITNRDTNVLNQLRTITLTDLNLRE